MIAGGIDGCKAGWLLIWKDQQGYQYALLDRIDDLERFAKSAAQFFIDIPIGLSSETFHRSIEVKLRKELKSRSATIFNAPCRAAVYEVDKNKAKELNKRILGKSLSEQTLNIKDKILETDRYINTSTSTSIQLLESHPEICFKYLNQGQILLSKKSQKEGVEQRLDLLSRLDPEAKILYKRILAETKRNQVKRDDILDALCLCLANQISSKTQTHFITDENQVDAQGIPVKLAYARL